MSVVIRKIYTMTIHGNDMDFNEEILISMRDELIKMFPLDTDSIQPSRYRGTKLTEVKG